MYDIGIIGGGTAGLTAAIYGQRAGKRRLCSPSGRNVHPENERFNAFFHFPICQMVCFYKRCKVGIKR